MKNAIKNLYKDKFYLTANIAFVLVYVFVFAFNSNVFIGKMFSRGNNVASYGDITDSGSDSNGSSSNDSSADKGDSSDSGSNNSDPKPYMCDDGGHDSSERPGCTPLVISGSGSNGSGSNGSGTEDPTIPCISCPTEIARPIDSSLVCNETTTATLGSICSTTQNQSNTAFDISKTLTPEYLTNTKTTLTSKRTALSKIKSSLEQQLSIVKQNLENMSNDENLQKSCINTFTIATKNQTERGEQINKALDVVKKSETFANCKAYEGTSKSLVASTNVFTAALKNATASKDTQKITYYKNLIASNSKETIKYERLLTDSKCSTTGGQFPI